MGGKNDLDTHIPHPLSTYSVPTTLLAKYLEHVVELRKKADDQNERSRDELREFAIEIAKIATHFANGAF